MEYEDPGALLDTGETGMVVAGGLRLARSESAVIVLQVITAFTRGLLVNTVIHLRGSTSPEHVMSIMYGEDSAGLRLGFGYERDTALELVMPGRPPLAPQHPPLWRLFNGYGGGGGPTAARCDASFALVPYPSSQTLVIAAAWPSRSIDYTSVIVELPAPSEVQRLSPPVWP